MKCKKFYPFLSGEGLTSLSINKRTNSFGEKKENESFPGVFLFENRRKNFKLNLVLVFTLNSKILLQEQALAES